MNTRSFWHRCFHDAEERIVIVQSPNIPLLGWVVCTVLVHVLPAASIADATRSLAGAFLFTWAYLELVSGVNYFRRALGVVVLTSILVRLFA